MVTRDENHGPFRVTSLETGRHYYFEDNDTAMQGLSWFTLLRGEGSAEIGGWCEYTQGYNLRVDWESAYETAVA